MAIIHPKWRTPAFSLIGQGVWGAVLTLSGHYDDLYTFAIFGMVLLTHSPSSHFSFCGERSLKFRAAIVVRDTLGCLRFMFWSGARGP